MSETRYWSCPEMWRDSTVVVIGGGPSLRGMNWGELRHMANGCRFIACNDGYRLGWPDMVFFGDAAWYDIHSRLRSFELYGGLLVSVAFECLGQDRIRVMERWPLNPNEPIKSMLTEPHRLTWYGNTGTTAILLAAKLGARKIVLLGFDMALSEDGHTNWYKNLKSEPTPGLLKKFVNETELLAIGMRNAWPSVKVINGLMKPDGVSGLECFEAMEWRRALKV
jgi:hypothetical protein